jgi:hypothetical protein
MPDIGEAPDPTPLSDGEKWEQSQMAAGVPAPEVQSGKDERTAALRTGGFTKDQIDAYWGVNKPTPKANAAGNSNVAAATQAKPDTTPSLLSDPLQYLGAALGTATDGLKALSQGYGNTAYAAAVGARQTQAVGSAGAGLGELNAAYASPDPSDPEAARDAFTTIGHLGMAAWDFSSAAFQEVLAAPMAALDAGGPGAAVSKIPIPATPGFQIKAGPLGQVTVPAAPATHLPQTWTGDTVGLVAGFALGGDHSLPPAAIPEATRYTAMEATHSGEFKTGPADIVPHHVDAPASPVVSAVKDAIPTHDDFRIQATRLIGHGLDVGTTKRVQHNLEQVWVNAGIHPADAVDMAERDPVYREELFHQDIAGNPVTPHFQSFRPTAPKPFATPKPEEGTAPLAGSVDDGLTLMKSLEASGVNAVSKTGAEGTYQIEPYTARQYMGADFDMSTLKDPAVNARVARVIMSDLYHRYQGNQEAMAIAYNAGPGRADKWVANTEGAGVRLEAVRDNSLRSGWRYTTVATARDEAWMPLETQQYVARARYKLGGHTEPEGVVHDGGPHVTTPDGTTPVQGGLPGEREPYEFKTAENGAEVDSLGIENSIGQHQKEEQDEPVIDHVDVHTGKSVFEGEASGGAASAWGLDRPYEDAENEVLSNIGEQSDLPAPKGLSAYDRFITAVMSRVQPAKVLSDYLRNNDELDEADYDLRDAFSQATKSPQRAQIAAGATEHGGGAVDWDPEKLEWTVNPEIPTARTAVASAIKNGGTAQGLMAWLLARRTMVLEVNRKINTGFNVGAASRMMADDGARAVYQDAADQWDAYNHNVLKYAVKSGWKSQAEADAIESAGAWVSMRALRGDEQGFRLPDKGFLIGNPLKRMRGKNGQIVDSLVASLDNNAQIFRSGDINLATHQLITHAEADPEFAATYGLRKVGTPKLPDRDVIDNALKAYGFDENDEAAMNKAREAFGSIIGERDDAKLGPMQFAYYRNGVKEIWETSAPEVANMIKGASPIQANMIIRVARDISAVVRIGIEAPVDFAIRAFGGHQMIQWMNNRNHPPPFITGFTGLLKTMNMHDLALEAMANGSMGTSLVDMDKDTLYDTMSKVLTDNGTLNHVTNDVGQYNAKVLKFSEDKPSIIERAEGVGNAIKNSHLSPIWLSRAVQERLDQGNRVGLYAQGRAKGMTGAKAGSNAAEAGIDYTNGGANAIISMWSSMVPFMRPSLLYTENALASIERNPAAYATYATMAVTLPKIALFAMNMYADSIPKGQPGYIPEADKYRNLPNWEKLYYYITPPIFGQRLKLRMPAFASFPFGAVPEAMMQTMWEHDPVKFMDSFQAWMRDTVPPLVPPLLQEPLTAISGFNMDTFQPLVPSSSANAFAELEQTPSSSVAAKALSRIVSPPLRAMGVPLKLSPIVIDHLTNGWLGESGRAIDQAVNAAAHRPGPPTDIADIPFVHGFFLSHPGLNGQVLDDYYTEKAKFDAQLANKQAIKKERTVDANPTEDQSMVPDAERYSNAESTLNKISKVLARQRLELWAINDSPTMSADEKLTQGTNITNYTIQLAYNATQQMRAFEVRHPAH